MLLLGDQLHPNIGIIVYAPHRGKRHIEPKEVPQTRLITTANRNFGDVMSIHANPVGNPGDGQIGTGQP